MVKSDDVFITYKEVKRFSYWIWLIIAPISILMWVGAFTQIIMGKPFGSKPANDITLLLLWVIFGIIFPAAFYSIKYKIELNSERLLIGLLPFYKKKIRLDEIGSCKVVSINPLLEFGGWGLRFNGQKVGLMVKGNKGIEIILKNKEIYVIASEKMEELYQQLNLKITN